MICDNLDQIITDGEMAEIESPTGVLSAESYNRLFAAYLLKGDICGARFLWNRIPEKLRWENEELKQLYKVYLALWNREISVFYSVTNFNWSTNCSEMIEALQERFKNDIIDLIGRAYSSIYDKEVMQMTNSTPEQLLQICQHYGWAYDPATGLVTPVPQVPVKSKPISSELQLAKLTEFVSFLEN